MIRNKLSAVINNLGYNLKRGPILKNYKGIFKKYKNYTMVPENHYYENLFLADVYIKNIKGDVIECGVWRGGMIAGIAELLGNERLYYLFDSFEGLPPAKDIDGEKAQKYQEEKDGPWYFNNCTAEIDFAEKAMDLAKTNHKIIKGWFNETLKNFEPPDIALLRLDGDWYDSTMDCLIHLYPHVVEDGIIIIDDYFTWDGCSRAVHDYLSQIKSKSRINKLNNICFIVKKD